MSATRPCEYRRSVVLAAPADKVFAFHENPHNIPCITPTWQVVRVLQGAETARQGEQFEIEVRLFGLFPLRWRGVWREASAPGVLVDEALSSPFAYWHHRHLFEPLDDGTTRMTDHVSYRFAGGLLGKWFGETLGRVQFHLMFADRQKRTAEWMRDHA